MFGLGLGSTAVLALLIDGAILEPFGLSTPVSGVPERVAATVIASHAALPVRVAVSGAASRGDRVYAVSLTQTASMSVAANGQGELANTVEAVWEWSPIDQTDDVTTWAMRLRDVRFSLSVAGFNKPASAAARMASEFEQTFYARQIADGIWTGVRHSADTSANVRLAIESLLSMIQFRMVDGDPAVWQGIERDALGDVDCTYQWRRDPADAAKEQLKKTKLRYRQAIANGDVPVEARIDRACFVATLDRSREGWGAFTSDSDVSISFGRGAMSARSICKLTAVRVDGSVERFASPVAPANGWAELFRTDIPEPNSSLQADRWRERLAGRGEAEFEDRLVAAFVADRRSPARVDATEELTWLLRLSPAAVEHLRTRLVAGEWQPAVRGAMFGALGAAGTREAQECLATCLAAPSLSPEDRRSVLLATFQISEPRVEFVAQLDTFRTSAPEELRGQALLALGAAVSRDSMVRTKLAGDVIKRLIEDRPREPALLATWLAALGNTTSPDALGSLSPGLSHDDLRVRRAAVKAIGKIASPAAVSLLVGSVTRDSDAGVRRRSVTVLSTRSDAPPIQTWQGWLRDERVPEVRKAILSGLATRYRDDPESAATLRHAARLDSDASTRIAARHLLERGE